MHYEKTKNKIYQCYCILLVIILCFFMGAHSTEAHLKAEDHNRELEAVLFGRRSISGIKDDVKLIEYASALCIDQYGGKGEAKFQELQNNWILGLPLMFSSIDYETDLIDKRTRIGPNTHRKFTHQGWDRDHEDDSVNKFLSNRENILRATINKVFDFGVTSTPLGYDERCESLCALIYYVHILGDYEEANKYSKLSLLIPLAGGKDTFTDKQGNKYKWTIISQLERYLPILFSDKHDDGNYTSMMEDISDLEKEADQLAGSPGSINTDEKFQEYHGYADRLLTEILEKYIPTLLRDEDFFSSIF